MLLIWLSSGDAFFRPGPFASIQLSDAMGILSGTANTEDQIDTEEH